MANKTNYSKEYKEKQFIPSAPKYGEQLGKKTIGIRLPLDVQESLLEMEQGERVGLMRQAISDAVRARNKS